MGVLGASIYNHYFAFSMWRAEFDIMMSLFCQRSFMDTCNPRKSLTRQLLEQQIVVTTSQLLGLISMTT